MANSMNNPKKSALSILFLYLLIISNISSAASANDSAPVKALEVMKSPFIVPGDKNVELQLILNSATDSTISNVKVFLFLNSPFTASISPNDKANELNYPGFLIGTGGNEYVPSFDIFANQGKTVKFKIDVYKNAKYGNYDIPYAIHYSNNRIINGKFNVRVSGSTLLEITNVSIIPDSIVPGSDFVLNFDVRNSGENSIKWVKVGILADDRKIIPRSSTSERQFMNLAGNASSFASYAFSTDRKLVPKNYPMVATLTYQDENGVSYNETKEIGIRVLGKAGLEIASIKTEPRKIMQGETFTLTIRLENYEPGDARSVKADIDIPMTGDKTAFLGTIATQEDAPAVFMLKADKSGNVNYNLTVYYVDDLGEHKQIQKILVLVYPEENNTIILLIVLAIILLSGYLFMQSKKKV